MTVWLVCDFGKKLLSPISQRIGAYNRTLGTNAHHRIGKCFRQYPDSWNTLISNGRSYTDVKALESSRFFSQDPFQKSDGKCLFQSIGYRLKRKFGIPIPKRRLVCSRVKLNFWYSSKGPRDSRSRQRSTRNYLSDWRLLLQGQNAKVF